MKEKILPIIGAAILLIVAANIDVLGVLGKVWKVGLVLAVAGGLLWLFLLPITIASRRRHRNLLGITLLNLLLGWTGIGWVMALIWSVHVDRP